MSQGGQHAASKQNVKSESPAIDSANDATIASEVGKTQSTDSQQHVGGIDLDKLSTSAGESDTSQSRFETVGNGSDSPSLFSHSNPTPWTSTRIGTVATVAAMVCMLAFIGWAVNTAMTPPTADDLYRSAVREMDRDAAEAFLARYPEDPRIENVRQVQMNAQLRTTLNRLNAKARIGLKPMSAAESSFLAAMQDRETNPAGAFERLSQWLAAFGDADRGSAVFDMSELAKYEAKRLAGENLFPKLDPRAEELLEEIRTAAQKSDAETLAIKLHGIIETFANENWAQPVLEDAERRLQELDSAKEAVLD